MVLEDFWLQVWGLGRTAIGGRSGPEGFIINRVI